MVMTHVVDGLRSIAQDAAEELAAFVDIADGMLGVDVMAVMAHAVSCKVGLR